MIGLGLRLGASSSAWSPTALGSSLWAWFRGDDVTTSGGVVSQWNDKSGNGRHVSQGTAANRPALSTIGGQQALDFDGSNDVLDSADLDASPLAQPFTIFIVAKDDLGTAGARTMVDANAGLSSNRATVYQPSNVVAFAGGALTSTDNMGTTARVLECVFNGASSKFRMNGGTERTGDVGANSWGQIHVGANNGNNVGSFWDGQIAEIIIASGALSDVTRAMARRYLGRRYGITVA